MIIKLKQLFCHIFNEYLIFLLKHATMTKLILIKLKKLDFMIYLFSIKNCLNDVSRLNIQPDHCVEAVQKAIYMKIVFASNIFVNS